MLEVVVGVGVGGLPKRERLATQSLQLREGLEAEEQFCRLKYVREEARGRLAKWGQSQRRPFGG